MHDPSALIAQLDAVLAERQAMKSRSKHADLSDVHDWDLQRLATRARAAIDRVGGAKSPYARQADAALAASTYYAEQVQRLVGVVECLRDDVAAGYLVTFTELVHANLFADFLEMAEHLLDEHYKDAAAVIAGSSLEAHLRQLCPKAGVEATQTSSGRVIPKKADQLNSDLTKAGTYSKLDQKSITTWLDLRNKAAHGHYDEYDGEQVRLMILGIQNFISRNPA